MGSPDRVVSYDEVQQAVVVVVKPRGSDAQNILAFAVQAGSRSHVSESTVAVVMVEGVGPRIADEDVIESIVVVVGDRHTETEAETGSRESSPGAHILKGSVAPVAQQAVVKFRRGLGQFRKAGAVGKKQVHAAVVVVIDGRDSPAHRLGEILSSGEVVVGAVGERRMPGNIGEPMGELLLGLS